MIESLVLIAAVLFINHQLNQMVPRRSKQIGEKKLPENVAKQLEYAEHLFQEGKYLAAEKVYLHLLNFDSRNSLAYNRLGLIYTHLKNYPDAIEAFQIASRYRPAAETFYNLGVVYLENRNYIKAIAALEKALIFQPGANVYVALSKASQLMSNLPRAIWAMERAVELSPDTRNLQSLALLYRQKGDKEKWQEVQQQLHKLQSSGDLQANHSLKNTNF